MKQKNVAYIIFLIGVVVLGLTYLSEIKEDSYIETTIGETGTCMLSDGTCLHGDRNYTLLVLGVVVSVLMVVFGIYLFMSAKSEEKVLKEKHKIVEKVNGANAAYKASELFKAFLKGFTEDEQKVLSSIKKQDGILQSTLRYKTGFSKATLSLLLKSLEERKIIHREPKGKSKQVFLKDNY